MNKLLIPMVCCAAFAAAPGPADARGCIRGAIVGGIAGHFAHHGLIGAAAGCMAGRAASRHMMTRPAPAAPAVAQPAPQSL